MNKKFTFIDLFAGIGGFHLAFHNVGATCVFTSEWDEFARKTYQANFEKIEPNLFTSGNFVGDITTVDKTSIPDFDILCAGFPCQPFSQAGHKLGFEDARGTLFFDIIRIVKYHKPKYILLENVSNILSHDNGNTYKVITTSLKDLGYNLPEHPLKISPHDLGFPIQRNRVFILAVRGNLPIPINFHVERRKK